MTKNYCLISHTHWDREWYIPFENFRMKLVDLIDNLLEILDNDPNYRFHLDAQTIVLEDYLEIKPHNFRRELEMPKTLKEISPKYGRSTHRGASFFLVKIQPLPKTRAVLLF